MEPSPEVLSQLLVCYVSCLGFVSLEGGGIGHFSVETNPIEIKYAFIFFLVRTSGFVSIEKYCILLHRLESSLSTVCMWMLT